MRHFVLNPETSKPAVAVVSHVDIERSELESAVKGVEEQLVAINAEHEQVDARKQELADQKAALESQLEEAKSELSGYDAVAVPEAGVDEGTAGDGGVDEAEGQPVESEESVNF